MGFPAKKTSTSDVVGINNFAHYLVMELSQEWIAVGNQKPKWQLTRRQWFILGCLSSGNFCLACCSSLQAPFFPQESEKKGATPSQYGLVFGIFYLTMSFFSPIWGRAMTTVTPKFLLDAGMFMVGACFILFGFLEKAPTRDSFLGLAYSIRIVEGIGSAAYKTSNFAIVANTFPDNVATAFGAMETMFGLGLIIGPSLGGALYEVGGFTVPFVVAGIMLLICGVVTFFALPESDASESVMTKLSVWKFLKNPAVALYAFITGAANMTLGFNHATLEPHIRQFGLTPLGVGLMFVLAGGLYGLTSPMWGYMCDKKYNAIILSAIGNMSLLITYVFIGPLPILNISTKLWLVILSLIFYGIGFGGTKVTAYIVCLHEARKRGYRIDLSIYGLISGTFNAAFAIGYFIGSAGGGILVQSITYEGTTGVIALLLLLTEITIIVFAVYRHREDARLRAVLGERSVLVPN